MQDSSLAQELLEAQREGHINLYLNYHSLTEIPQEVLSLSKIKRLYLRRNLLKKLPADIWRLEELVELNLEANSLQELPEGIGKLALLHTLNVSNNFLKRLTPALGLLKSLESLNIANNELTFLPKELGTLQNLKVLNVANNKLRWLPWQLCECTSLETLAFDRNAVQTIPQQLTTHKKLTELSASGNKLIFLPHDVNLLMSLESLLLDNNNKLHHLPATLLKLETLKTIGLNRLSLPRVTTKLTLLSPSLSHNDCGQEHQTKDYCELKDVLNVKEILGMNHSIPKLVELALRTNYPLIQPTKDDGISSLLIPCDLANLLNSPTGHCYICCRPYFTAVFPLVENASTAFQIVQPSSLALLKLRDTRISFVFSCCSISCLFEVRRIRNSVSPELLYINE